MKTVLTTYLKTIAEKTMRPDSTESSYYGAVETLFSDFPLEKGRKTRVTTLPKRTEAGNPDFRVWDGENFIVGYIEAKLPGDLDNPRHQEQFDRYTSTFPNVILTDFYDFRLFRDGIQIDSATIGRHFTAKLKQTPTLENLSDFERLAKTFFEFKLPKTFTAESLATQLARRTRFMRDIIHDELQEELAPRKGSLYTYFQAFQKFLIPSLTPVTFADLYAQTVTYGLFAARTRIPEGEPFTRRRAFDYIPHTVGILRDVFRYISLEDPSDQLKVIIDDIAAVLNASDINSILEQYYRQGKGEDPILHFYETFLNQYDPATREARGVYYTPEPVVKYIVRSVHELLKSEFGLSDGLATRGVTLLDPAAGTLTFPAEAIKLAVEEYGNKYGEGGKEGFIRDQILPNFYAFELMMAPYAIGHMKVAYLLESLGYKMSGDDAFKLYLTNTLEMKTIAQSELPGLHSLSEESHKAGLVKNEPILVIIGNPPYSGHSANNSDDLKAPLRENRDGAQSYFIVDGKPLGERNPKWLQDDYVKFLRFAQWKIQKAGRGIVAMITNHGWLDNPTFRGMRQSLMGTFDRIYILDLHGNSIKKEISPDGSRDENVFDIRVGTAISIFVKTEVIREKSEILFFDQYGSRLKKYTFLSLSSTSTTEWKKIEPEKDLYLLKPINQVLSKKYLSFQKITEIFPTNGIGIATHRDKFVVDESPTALHLRVSQFTNLLLPDNILREAYGLNDTRDWNLSNNRKALSKTVDIDSTIMRYAYRPLDDRFISYSKYLIEFPRQDLLQNMLLDNLAILVGRQGQAVGDEFGWNLSFITDKLSDVNVFYRGGATVCPLYIYKDNEEFKLFPNQTDSKTPNIDKKIFSQIREYIGTDVTTEEIFFYIYAILYSPYYRNMYSEFLKTDFPRIPFTSDPEVFRGMARLGERLKDLHLLQSKELEDSSVRFQGKGEDVIQFRRYDSDQKRLYINNDKYFENLEPEVWEYQIGGYQVLDKYIKDRKGRPLSDPRHIIRIATALEKTIAIQNEIDALYAALEESLAD